MSYISSGQFQADVETITGEALFQPAAPEESDDSDPQEDPLARFPQELRTELQALRELSLPSLCVLSWGDFCSVPELYGEEREEVLEDWFEGDEEATDFVMSAVDIVNGGGGFYIVVNTDGRMGLVCEDPYSFDALACTMPAFLQALIAAHQAACSQGLEAAKAEFLKVVDDDTANLLLTFAARLAPQAKG